MGKTEGLCTTGDEASALGVVGSEGDSKPSKVRIPVYENTLPDAVWEDIYHVLGESAAKATRHTPPQGVLPPFDDVRYQAIMHQRRVAAARRRALGYGRSTMRSGTPATESHGIKEEEK
jgi:hypothetical protein